MFFPLCFCLLTVNDTLDEIFEDSGDEEESQDIVNQVLDEIGIEISGKVRTERLYGINQTMAPDSINRLIINVVH